MGAKYGYIEKMLFVDPTRGRISEKEISEDDAKSLIGGSFTEGFVSIKMCLAKEPGLLKKIDGHNISR